MNMLITQCVQAMVISGRMDAREIARAVGKPYSTLMRELNPWDSGAKLGADTLLAIIKITGDTSPLEVMAQELGCVLLPGGNTEQFKMTPGGRPSLHIAG